MPMCSYRVREKSFASSALSSDSSHHRRDRQSSRCGFHDERISTAWSVIDPDALRLEIPVDRLHTVLTAETGGFITAEGHKKTHRPVGIDPHSAGFDPSRHCMCALERLCPYTGTQPIGNIVGDLDCLVFILELDYESTGPKISSWAIRILLVTPVKIVGLTKYWPPPSSCGAAPPPNTHFAPSPFAMSM